MLAASISTAYTINSGHTTGVKYVSEIPDVNNTFISLGVGD